MIRKDSLQKNGDDWLAKEIARESRISAWDMDEGKDLRREHEENCDARELADQHHYRHLRRMDGTPASKADANAIGWFVIDMLTVFLLFVLNIFLPNTVIIPGIVLFLMLNPGIFVWLFLLKRFPSQTYLKFAFEIAIILEIYFLFIENSYFLRSLIWRLMR